MDSTTPQDILQARAKRLKAATSEAHDRLDARIMASAPFASLANYGRFLTMQFQFHRHIDALYDFAPLAAQLPDLAARRRLPAIRQDLVDLALPVPPAGSPEPLAPAAIDLAAALGWLYVAEGSNLGAAFLFKMARALGLDETRGARHLAGHPYGRALHWRTFTAALDAVPLDDEEERRVAAAAREAFRYVRELAEPDPAAA